MNSNKNKIKNNNKILLPNIENNNNSLTRGPDLSTGNLCTSDYSTIFTNSNIYNNTKYSNMDFYPTPISEIKNTAYNTIDDYNKDMFYLTKINFEHDIYLSSLKKQLAIIKEERKLSEMNVTNLKRKIIELQKEEQKSLKQLENTKKYIKKIIDNRKKHNYNNINNNKTKKNFDIKITKINNIFKTNRSPINKVNTRTNYSCNTWFSPNKKKRLIKNHNLTFTNDFKGKENNRNNNIINNSLNINSIFKGVLNNKNNNNRNVIHVNLRNNNIYNKKKIRNKIIRNNNNINNNIFTHIKNIKSDTKLIKENLIKTLKKDEEEKLKIQKQIEEIEKEQNSLFSNFNENFGIYHSSKTLDLEDNFLNTDY